MHSPTIPLNPSRRQEPIPALSTNANGVGPTGTIRAAAPAPSGHQTVTFPSIQHPPQQTRSPSRQSQPTGSNTRSSHHEPPTDTDFGPQRSISPLSVGSMSSTGHPSLTRLAAASYSRVDQRLTSSSSQIMQPITWSEMADEDLVGNLGGRERTRQEVLWEMVGSEERSVCLGSTEH
jgi:hypothetical protein